MSGETEQAPSKAGPKAPTITSAFINKGAKTFAPKKAIRRRPAAAAAAPKPPVSAPPVDATPQQQPDASPAEEHAQLLPEPTPVQEQPAAAPPPTPAATQEPASQNALPADEAPTQPATTIEPNADAAPAEPLPTPASTNEIPVPPMEDSVTVPSQPEIQTVSTSGASPDTTPGPSSRPPALEVTERDQTQQTEPATIAEPTPTTHEQSTTETSTPDVHQGSTIEVLTEQSAETTSEPATNAQPMVDSIQTAEVPVMRTAPSEPSTETGPAHESQGADTANTATPEDAIEPTEERTWNAINVTDDRGEASAPRSKPAGPKPIGPKPGGSKPVKPTARRKRKAVTLRNMDEEEQEQDQGATGQENGDVEDDYVPPQVKRPSAKARGKRKAAEAPVGEDDGTVQPPPKKKRQPRKPKAKEPTTAGDGQEAAPGDENVENGESSSAAARATPARKRKRQSTSQPNGEGEQQPRRRGRQPREPTPSDAEDELIDEDNFFMDDLARRNLRIGRLSQREKKMREINWEEVKQRQREKEAEQMNSRAVHAEMERQAQEREDAVRTLQEQVRYENVGGEMRIVQGSGQVNYEAIADTRYAEEVVEEDDFTNRITSRSFMRNNKRYPEEFLLPGQGKRWDIRSTQDFYDALRMFGTDFGMMTTLFEGVSRRSLKLKFNREERKQPEVIKEILQQKDTRLGNWDNYLKASGKESEQYDRAELIKQELEAAEEEARRQIEEAKAEYEEEKRQKRLAGFMSDEEGGGEAGKKKGKKGKDKHVTFQQEEDGVEILDVDEDDGWGAE